MGRLLFVNFNVIFVRNFGNSPLCVNKYFSCDIKNNLKFFFKRTQLRGSTGDAIWTIMKSAKNKNFLKIFLISGHELIKMSTPRIHLTQFAGKRNEGYGGPHRTAKRLWRKRKFKGKDTFFLFVFVNVCHWKTPSVGMTRKISAMQLPSQTVEPKQFKKKSWNYSYYFNFGTTVWDDIEKYRRILQIKTREVIQILMRGSISPKLWSISMVLLRLTEILENWKLF